MTTLKLSSRILFGLASGMIALALALASLLVAPTKVAYAAQGTPPAPESAAARNERLMKWYQREQEWLGKQAQHLAKAGEAAGKVQSWIDELKAKGQDTAALEAALAAFNQQRGAAQAAHEAAASILGTHAGFDDNGQVTDPELARQTLTSARQALAEAHHLLRQAERALHQAIREWRQGHR